MGADGLSQSINDNMLQLLQTKRDLAEKEYIKIVQRLKALYGNKLFSSNV
jgi:acyl-CoA-binding protein